MLLTPPQQMEGQARGGGDAGGGVEVQGVDPRVRGGHKVLMSAATNGVGGGGADS